ncbi:hypothetical protein P8605_11560 [Streptomyces sp. T-3]|nr:hypothetical protein [Streptomyces sp. T-3]
MEDTEGRGQHNHGSGTFVGGDVHGGFWQVFVPPYGKQDITDPPSRDQHPEEANDDEPSRDQRPKEGDDYEDLHATLLFWFVAGCTLCVGAVHEAMGWPWAEGAPPPGFGERIIGALIFSYACLACVAAFFARLAQVFELWSAQCADTAVQSRGRWVARPPALIAKTMSGFASLAAVASEVLASLYGWRSFGGEVSRRAHTARLHAAANAATARDAALGNKD